MSKSQASTPELDSQSELNPQNVQWGFYSLNEDGEVVFSLERPAEQRVVAMINSSSWIQLKMEDKSAAGRANTPGHVKKLVARILNVDLDGRKPNLCVAVPLASLEEMQEYYGKKAGFNIDAPPANMHKFFGNTDFGVVEECYVRTKVHDDLQKGDVGFVVATAGERPQGTMPPEEGAEQIASAIENGFDIWTAAGGNSIFPKLLLCEKYFAQKSIGEFGAGRKVYVIGFSDGSKGQFLLRGLVNFIHYSGVRPAFYAGNENTIQSLVRALETEEMLTYKRIMQADGIEAVQTRYNAIMQDGDVISNITFFPNALTMVGNAVLPKFKDNEKIILGLEGYLQTSTGYNVSEALRRNLELKLIDPDKVLFISIEDMMRVSEQFEVEKVDGLIPDFEELSQRSQGWISDLAKKRPMTEAEYIAESNQAFQAEVAKIKEVAARFGISVVNGGKHRCGHSQEQIIQPLRVIGVEFLKDGRIIQTSAFVREEQEMLISDAKKDRNLQPNWSDLSVSTKDAQEEISKAKLIALNDQAKSGKFGEERVIVGNDINIANTKVANDEGIIIKTAYTSIIDQVSELYHVIEDQIKEAKFVILLLENPKNLTDEKFTEFLEIRNQHLTKLFTDLHIETPVFIMENSIDQSKLPNLFADSINLQQMISAKPHASTRTLTSESLESDDLANVLK